MTTIFIIQGGVSYEGNTVVGVRATEQEAWTFRDEFSETEEGKWYDGFDVQEWEVGGGLVRECERQWVQVDGKWGWRIV